MSWRHLPPPARPVAAGVAAAVSAAGERDAGSFDDAVAALAALDRAQVRLVLGTVVRVLLEDGHPDGLDADDVRAVLRATVLTSTPWQPEVDAQVLVLLLTGALGVYDPDDRETAPEPAVVARHGALLAAELLAGRPVADVLARSFAEIERTQLND